MTQRIIKKQDAVFDGAVIISANSVAGGKPNTESPAAGKISAKVVDKTADFLVIEIICPCGRKSFIKCQYSKNEITDTEKK